MKKKLIILSLIIFGCQFPEKEKNYATNVEKKELFGNWKADIHSYNLTVDFSKNKKENARDSISLMLNDNMEFKFENAIYIENGELQQKTFSGKWQLVNVGEPQKPSYLIVFAQPSDLPEYLKNGLVIYQNGLTLQLVSFMDDPDLGDRILLNKEIIQ